MTGFWFMTRQGLVWTTRHSADVLVQLGEETLADGVRVTDEAMAVELAGGRVRVLPGPPSNIKVTLEADLAFAELLLLQQNREGS